MIATLVLINLFTHAFVKSKICRNFYGSIPKILVENLKVTFASSFIACFSFLL